MKNKLLSVSAIALLGIAGGILPAHSQALPDYVQQELLRTDELINETNEFIETVLYPQAEAQRIYERQLYSSCLDGDSDACTELQDIEERRVQWMIENDCRYRTALNSCYK
jgi:predicted transcriptional regulator